MCANKTILVVDDNEDDRVLLQELFESHGYVVLLANNGETAQEILISQWVDFVISDVLMPILDGLQLCRMIKNNVALSHIFVVLYTSMYSSDDDVSLAKSAGADHHMIKPFEPNDLLDILDNHSCEKRSSKSRGDFSLVKPIFSEEEKRSRQYNTRLVNRLASEVKKLGYEIEKRKAIELELREIQSSMMNALITIDSSGKILTFNHAAEVLFSYPSSEVVGKNVKLLMADSVAMEHDRYINQYCQTGATQIIGSGDGREVFGRRKNKQEFPMRLLVSELPRDAYGKQRFIGTCQDLTTLKAQDEQLRRSQKMEALGKLTGGIAHDYNNMLGVVTGFAELLERELAGQPKLERYAQQIMHAGERGIKLTKQLLSFSRKKNSGAELLNINAFLQGEQNILRKILTARIELKINVETDLWLVLLDAGDLEDAVINMTINAMHAIDGNGVLIIQTNNAKLEGAIARQLQLPPGEYVVLSLKDSGCGMTEEVRENIFDPFYSTKGENGTGLGLSQVHSFVERSGGAIEVHSVRGKGALFALYFPKSQAILSMLNETAATTDEGLSGNEAILILDDEPALVELAECVLIERGYTVFTANNGKQALHILEENVVDLVVSDVIMPDMDGYQFIAEVRAKYPAIKLQMISGYSDSHDYLFENESDNDLLQRMLHKPYETHALLACIRELLDEC